MNSIHPIPAGIKYEFSEGVIVDVVYARDVCGLLSQRPTPDQKIPRTVRATYPGCVGYDRQTRIPAHLILKRCGTRYGLSVPHPLLSDIAYTFGRFQTALRSFCIRQWGLRIFPYPRSFQRYHKFGQPLSI